MPPLTSPENQDAGASSCPRRALNCPWVIYVELGARRLGAFLFLLIAVLVTRSWRV